MFSPNNTVYAEGGDLKTTALTDQNYLLWKEGIVYFDNETVLKIMKKLELFSTLK